MGYVGCDTDDLGFFSLGSDMKLGLYFALCAFRDM